MGVPGAITSMLGGQAAGQGAGPQDPAADPAAAETSSPSRPDCGDG